MHISIVTREMGAGGAERVIVQLLKEWISSDNICDLILLEKSKKFYEVPDGTNVYEIGQQSKNPIIDKLKRYSLVRKKIKKNSSDIVLAMPEEIGIYVIGAMIGANIPVVVSERNNPWRMPYKKVTRFLRRLLYPYATGFVFQSEKAKSFFSNSIQKKGIVLPNPIDLKRIPEPYIGERKKKIVAAGRLEPQKNIKMLIDAFSLFERKHTDYELIVYGDGYLRSELKEYAEAKGIDNACSFPGNVNNLLEKIKDATCFVLTSDYEGMPNALIEAMAVGMPVISTDYEPGTVGEIIHSYFNGIVVPKSNPKELRQALEFIITHKEEARQMSEQALRIRKRFDSKTVAKEWIAFLKNVKRVYNGKSI